MTAVESHCVIIELVADLFPPQDQDRWMLTHHPVPGGDWPSLSMQNGNVEAVYKLLLRLKRGI